MKIHLFFSLLFFCCFSTSILMAQHEGQPKQNKIEPIKILEEIQQKMDHAETMLNRSIVGYSGGGENIDRTQRAIQRRLERLMGQGKSQDEIVAELNKFIERKKKKFKKSNQEMSSAVKEIEKLLKSSENQQNTVAELNTLLESQQQMKKALKNMDKMFENIEQDHQKAIQKMQKLIRMAQKSSSSQPISLPNEGEEPQTQDQEKPEHDGQPQRPEQQKKQQQEERDPLNQQKMKPPVNNQDQNKRNNADDKDRWGNLPARARKNFYGIDSKDLPDKYKQKIQEYIKKLNEQKSK